MELVLFAAVAVAGLIGYIVGEWHQSLIADDEADWQVERCTDLSCPDADRADHWHMAGGSR